MLISSENQHVGVFRAGFEQDVGVGGASGDGADVQAILQRAQLVTVRVHHGDVVLFVGQVFRERAADLASSENDDLHGAGGRVRMVVTTCAP
jgi:hypothetical protein